jgi:NADPH-dependent glutamate synthase beta subunit-like oxidoreductase
LGTARRPGATDAVLVYRRTRDRMPAHDFEVEEAIEERIEMKWLSTVKRIDGGVLTVKKMALDAKGAITMVPEEICGGRLQVRHG